MKCNTSDFLYDTIPSKLKDGIADTTTIPVLVFFGFKNRAIKNVCFFSNHSHKNALKQILELEKNLSGNKTLKNMGKSMSVNSVVWCLKNRNSSL